MVTVALVLVGPLVFLSYHSIGIHRSLAAGKRLRQRTEGRDAGTSTDPQELLAEANRLYWLNNGTKAAPLYAAHFPTNLFVPLTSICHPTSIRRVDENAALEIRLDHYLHCHLGG